MAHTEITINGLEDDHVSSLKEIAAKHECYPIGDDDADVSDRWHVLQASRRWEKAEAAASWKDARQLGEISIEVQTWPDAVDRWEFDE